MLVLRPSMIDLRGSVLFSLFFFRPSLLPSFCFLPSLPYTWVSKFSFFTVQKSKMLSQSVFWWGVLWMAMLSVAQCPEKKKHWSNSNLVDF